LHFFLSHKNERKREENEGGVKRKKIGKESKELGGEMVAWDLSLFFCEWPHSCIPMVSFSWFIYSHFAFGIGIFFQ